jgi:hypothetical protein
VLRVTFSGIRDSVRVVLEVRMDRLALKFHTARFRARRLRLERSRMNRAEDFEFSVRCHEQDAEWLTAAADVH